jgi:hypothetical protein
MARDTFSESRVAAFLMRATWTTAKPPSLVAQSFPGDASQNGQRILTGLTGSESLGGLDFGIQ